VSKVVDMDVDVDARNRSAHLRCTWVYSLIPHLYIYYPSDIRELQQNPIEA
jgi:hypothetical protein